MPARFIATVCLVAILTSVTFAAAPVVEPTGMWSGKVKDISLRRLAPQSGFIADAEAWKKLWTAWRPSEELPKVDFARELILVGTVPGPNLVIMRPTIDDKGNVKFIVGGTKIGGPGFGYKLIKMVREGVKTVNGKAATDEKPAANPAQVQAKVLYGTAAEQQDRADIELWISKIVAKAGSRSIPPRSGWIALSGDHQRLDTANGFYIDGKAIERSGTYQVEIDGCDGGPLDKTVLLKPYERRVVTLYDDPTPENVFIALKAPVSERAKERAEAMKANAKTFRLELNYHGEQRKPFYRLIVSVPAVNRRRNSPFNRIVQVNEEQATGIIDHLAGDGFLDKAVDLRPNIKIPPTTMPGYTMKVTAGDTSLYEDLGWGLPMIQRLDDLRDALPDTSKRDMDLLLGRLSGWRKRWEAELPALETKGSRGGSRIRFLTEDDTTIIDITSEFGIDELMIRRKSDKWPESILARLHLSGLESFQAGGDDVAVEWSVSSTGDNPSRVALRKGRDELALDEKSPYHTAVRIVVGNGKIPLKDGYFEVPLPAKLFEGNPEEITLGWIDFYRE